MKILLITLLSLFAFAGNSILCRIALGQGQIDAASFTSIRLFSGAITLFILYALFHKNKQTAGKGSWLGAVYLFIYAVTFSYAYISLETAIGALVLFSSVQFSMLAYTFFSGTKIYPIEWCGALIAFIGFSYLVLPDISSPSLIGFVLMMISGMAWAGYTLAGRKSSNPLADTAFNFIRTLPFISLLSLISLNSITASTTGVLLAVIAGSVTSGIGYAIWYFALKHLTSVQAAVSQLSVPIIASIGGFLFLSEPISERLAISGAIILNGILLVVLGKKPLKP
ncbi:EamA-like transporter family protein [Pseudoalteromonas sp. P1-9]|uniref:DMT family transporter n=1 Tax=Pseudoalteromonas sp. P1-9 TaxID=1710354 RepID=UPI0006D600B2|nr:DMT family transporter [Pseudoalteromonas sp. P1-9]KPV96072.1 EamA-like transporter family protein [Pseudoalteromonas sp. P1-9]